jgi:hypothetical protein
MTDSNNWFQQWPGWQALVSTAQRRGADSFGLMYGDGKNRRAMRFGRGSFMLDWNGKGGAFVFHVADGSDPFNTAWVRQLGSPVAPKVRRAQGVWQRRYEQGVVVVNARSEAVTYASREFRELSAPATQGSSPCAPPPSLTPYSELVPIAFHDIVLGPWSSWAVCRSSGGS